MKKIFLPLFLIYFTVCYAQVDDSPCDANSWGAYECIQFLQRSVLELQDQLRMQSAQLAAQFDQLQKQTARLENQSDELGILRDISASQTYQLENLSVRLDNHSVKVDNQSVQLESHSVKLSTLSDLSVTQSVQLEIFSSQMVTFSAMLAAQSTQLATQSVQLTSQSAQIISHSTQLNAQSSQLLEQSAQLEGLQNNSIPIGFIYIQLPSQPTPNSLWQNGTWQDVTNDYAGLFFRVLGGNSESFENIQAKSSPRLIEVETIGTYELLYHNHIYPNDVWTAGVSSGAWTSDGHWRLRFKQSQAEVRPRNTAVRIWRKMN